ncbi:MAG: hypothetical protein AAF267_09615 [Deinococcota bacterium]
MKSSWVPWGAVIALILLFFLLVINGTISFDGPSISTSNNDIRPPNVRGFRINGVREGDAGDVIKVIDGAVLTEAELDNIDNIVIDNIVRFEVNISDESTIELVELTLFRLLPQPFGPTPYAVFVLEPPYDYNWDASDAPNGIYSVQLRSVDVQKNEGLVNPDIRLALLRFGNPITQTPQTIVPQTSTPQPTPPTPAPRSQAQPVPQELTPTPATTPVTQPTPTGAAGAPQVTTAGNTIQRRDLVFTVIATIFFTVLVNAGRLFAAKWPQDTSQEYSSLRIYE